MKRASQIDLYTLISLQGPTYVTYHLCAHIFRLIQWRGMRPYSFGREKNLKKAGLLSAPFLLTWACAQTRTCCLESQLLSFQVWRRCSEVWWWVVVIGTRALWQALYCVIPTSLCSLSLLLSETDIPHRLVWLMAQHHCVALVCLPESEFQLLFFLLRILWLLPHFSKPELGWNGMPWVRLLNLSL